MRIIIIFVLQICIKSDRRLFIQSFFDDILKIRERTATDKQNVPCIYSHHRYHGILAGSTHRNFHFTSLQKFQKSLLDSLSADISLVGILFLCDLIDLIDENDPVLCLLHIIICSRKELGYYALDIITDITSLCKRCGICNGKRYLKKSGKHLHQISLTAACRSDHQHIGFLDLNIIHGICGNSFIMVVYTYRHYLLGIFLSDHIFIQSCFDLMWCRNIFEIDHRLRSL